METLTSEQFDSITPVVLHIIFQTDSSKDAWRGYAESAGIDLRLAEEWIEVISQTDVDLVLNRSAILRTKRSEAGSEIPTKLLIAFLREHGFNISSQENMIRAALTLRTYAQQTSMLTRKGAEEYVIYLLGKRMYEADKANALAS